MDNRPQRGNSWLIFAIILLAVVFGALFVKKYTGRVPAPQQVAVPPLPTEGVRSVTLFFSSPDGAGLVRETHEIGPCSDLGQCVEETLDELINGPLGDLSPTLPETSLYRGVKVEGDLLLIDIGRELQDGLLSGSSAEMFAAYSVVNTITVNFPEIKRIKFLVEGKSVDTLKGHLDLREPLFPDYSLEWHGSVPAAAQPAQRRKP